MFAAGAMPCTASTSRVSSPYQPCGSCFLFCGRWSVPGAITCVNCELLIVGRPRLIDHWFASWRIVGDAYASMIATVWPAPSYAFEMPYAPLICAGVLPLTDHGAVGGSETSVKPSGYA